MSDILRLQGVVPPPAPRALPPEVPWRLRFSRNPWSLVGFAFVGPLLCTGCFPLIGLPLFAYGLASGQARVRLLRTGLPARGQVISVGVDPSITMNGRHGYQIAYAFETGAGVSEGRWTTFDQRVEGLREGDEIGVVYSPRTGASAPWPPLT